MTSLPSEPRLELISMAKSAPTPHALNERWLVTLTVTRDPNLEDEPLAWNWQEMIGGHPMILRTQIVGAEPRVEEEADAGE